MKNFKHTVIFLLHFYVLEAFLAKCDFTGYKRINIKDIIKQKNYAQPNEYFMFDETPNNGKPIQKTVNARIKEILKDINDVELLQNIENNYIQGDSDLKYIQKDKDSSDSSDTSNENIYKRTLQSKDETLGSLNIGAASADVIKNNETLRFGGTCNKGASKACISACKGVLKNVCDEYRCKSDLKKRFKQECQTNCRKRFNVS
ncbi:hypothetical protein O0L34_g18788 [Tuta absoluta]|nr:hypothetical protein O0L34_g18788 [Tuta absoluta]